MRKISKVSPREGYCLEVEFDDGVCGIVNLSNLVGKGVFGLWIEPGAFERVRIGSFGELYWDDKVDLCPDSLYLKLTGKTAKEVFPALNQAPAHA